MKLNPAPLLAVTLGFAGVAAQAAGSFPHELLYIGTTGPDGIYSAWLDQSTGELSSPAVAMSLNRAQWLAASPTRPVLYSVATASGGRSTNSVIYSLKLDPGTGELKVLNSVDAGGLEATYLDVDSRSHTLINANHDSGSISAFPILADGSLDGLASLQTETGSGPNEARQGHAIAHCAIVDPSGKYVLAADLGADRIFVYRLDAATHALTPAGSQILPPGTGPRHLLFDPRGQYAYLLTELSSEMFVLRWDAKNGQLHQIQSLAAYPADYTDKRLAAELGLSRDGRFLYVSLRGANSLVVYAVNNHTGTLQEIQRIPSGGQSPRAFTIDPSGRWLLVAQDASDSVTTFRINKVNGMLASTGRSAHIPKPADLVFYVR